MSEAEAEAKPASEDSGLDEHGLVVHTYRSKVLVVVPSEGYAEVTMRYARSALFNVNVGTTSVSIEDDKLIQGALQDEFQVDAKLDGSTTMESYSGVIFCAGSGALAMADDANVQRLAREAAEAGKLIAAWGESVAVLAKAGILKKKKVTGHPSLRDAVAAAGGKLTGCQVEADGNIITGADDGAGLRFARLLVKVVGI